VSCACSSSTICTAASATCLTAILARVAAKIYENSILRTGGRVSRREALKEV
jgi:hypothetical protein